MTLDDGSLAANAFFAMRKSRINPNLNAHSLPVVLIREGDGYGRRSKNKGEEDVFE